MALSMTLLRELSSLSERTVLGQSPALYVRRPRKPRWSNSLGGIGSEASATRKTPRSRRGRLARRDRV